MNATDRECDQIKRMLRRRDLLKKMKVKKEGEPDFARLFAIPEYDKRGKLHCIEFHNDRIDQSVRRLRRNTSGPYAVLEYRKNSKTWTTLKYGLSLNDTNNLIAFIPKYNKDHCGNDQKLIREVIKWFQTK